VPSQVNCLLTYTRRLGESAKINNGVRSMTDPFKVIQGPSTVRWVLLNLLLALAYYLAARAGMATSIGPSSVTAIWPPSGLALRALLLWSWRALPGLFAGAFLLNWLGFLWPALGSHTPALLGALLLSISSMAQAGLAAGLLHGLPERLEEAPTQQTLWFTLCVALSCLVAPTLGSAYLQWAGLLPAEDLTYSWLVWWTGDCAGMLVVTPLLLVWLHGAIRRDPIASLTFPIVSIGLGLTLITTAIVGYLERDSRISQFRAQSRELAAALQHELDFTQRDLEVLAALHQRTQVSLEEFRRLASSMHERSPWQHNLSWLPRLDGGGEPRFGRLWTVPLEGLDTVGQRQEADDPLVLPALASAAQHGRISATGLLTGLDGQWLTLRLYGPVVDAATAQPTQPATPYEPARVRGLVSVTLDLAALLRSGDMAAQHRLLNLQWTEEPADSIMQSASPTTIVGIQTQGGHVSGLTVSERWPAQRVEERLLLRVADRNWRLVTRPQDMDRWITPSMLQVGVFGSGLAFTALLAGVSVLRRRRDLDQAGEHERLTREVAERTQALSDSNARLNAELRERGLLDAALREARERAEAANQAKSMFLANMSHEIRTPLNAVIGYAQLLREDARLPEGARERILAIDGAGRRLLQLINDVLDLSKIEAGNLSLNPEAFELGRELQDLARLMRQRAESKGLQLDLLLELPEPCWVNGDRQKLGQVLLNLLGNAIKFTPQGRVRLRAGLGKAGWVAEIEDSGPGLTREEQAELFEPFRQGASGRAQGGTGLGLALSRRLADAMGGTLTLDSTPGQGTRVRLTLPLVHIEAPADAASPQAPRLRLLPREGTPACRLLVVEDDPASRDILVQTLTALGAQVLQAGQGEEALALMERLAQAEQPPVDLVFTDIRMPVLDGLGLLRQIRQRWGTALPVVAVSASSLEHERRFYVGEGFQDFVGKPYDLQEIYRMLLQHLPGRWVEAMAEAEAKGAPAGAGSPPQPATGSAVAASPGATAPASRSPALIATLQRLAAAAREGDVAAVRQAMAALQAPQTLTAAQPPATAGLDSDTARRLAQAVQQYDFDTLAALADQGLAAIAPGAAP
jgi:signal transduction histidine kinase/CheY-like chemotaxis protein